MTDNKITLRAHHGMCLQYFVGKGYSSGFTANMGSVKEMLETDNPEVTIVDKGDLVCRKCPNHLLGKCLSSEKVGRYDKGVLDCCNIESGTSMKYADFVEMVKEKVIDAGMRERICGDCQWTDLCK